MQPRPATDYQRLDRVVADISETMRFSSLDDAKRARIERWVHKTIAYISRRGPWWWLENSAGAEIPALSDIVDLCGHIGFVRTIYAPKKLRKTSYKRILALRATAAADGSPNGGLPNMYAIESGFRVHLWPCPAAPVQFMVLYDRPPDVALLPIDWDGIIHDGAIGLYGRHFDKAGLVDDPRVFEARFLDELYRARASASPGDDVTDPYCRSRASDHVDARSAIPRPITFVAPVSLEGVPGYVSLPIPGYDLCPTDTDDGGVFDPCAAPPIFYSDAWGYDGTVEYIDTSGCEGAGQPGDQCEAEAYTGWAYDGTVEYILCGEYTPPVTIPAPPPDPVPDPGDIPVLVPDYQRTGNGLALFTSQEIPLPFGTVIDAAAPWSLSWDAFAVAGTGMEQLTDESTDPLSTLSFNTVVVNAWYNRLGAFHLGEGSMSGLPDLYYDDFQQQEWHRYTLSVDPVAGTFGLSVENPGIGLTHDIVILGITPDEVRDFAPPAVLLVGGVNMYGSCVKDYRLAQGGEELAWWPMDEGPGTGTGDTLHDRSGNGHDFSIRDIGGAQWIEAPHERHNAALLFDGAVTRIELPWGDLGIDLSLKWHLTMTVIAVSNGVAYPICCTVGTTAADPHHFRYRHAFATTGDRHVELGAYSGSIADSTDAAVAGSQYLLTVTADGSPNFLFSSQKNAEQGARSSDTFAVGAAPYAAFLNGGVLALGADGSSFFHGVIRDVRVFNQADLVNPVAWWPIDDVAIAGGVIRDRSGNGHHGVLAALGGGIWQPIN